MTFIQRITTNVVNDENAILVSNPYTVLLAFIYLYSNFDDVHRLAQTARLNSPSSVHIGK